MATKVVINPVFLKVAPLAVGVQAVLQAVGEKIVEAARASFESEPHPFSTGAYLESIEVQDGDVPGSKRVIATDWKSNWVEFGTEHSPAFAPLRRGADSVGVVLVGGKDGD